MDMFNEVIEISSSSDEIYKFYDYCVEEHQAFSCTIPNYEVTEFLSQLDQALTSAKSYDYQRNFSVAHCAPYPNVFKTVFQLRQKNISPKALAKGLKFVTLQKQQQQLKLLLERSKQIEKQIKELSEKF